MGHVGFLILLRVVFGQVQRKSVGDASCSGKAKVISIGKNAGNYIEFRDVYATKAGKYTLKLYYACAGDRHATVTVNGIETQLSGLNSGSAKTFAKTSLPVTLKKGYNIIRISNAMSFAPDIDKIEVNLNK